MTWERQCRQQGSRRDSSWSSSRSILWWCAAAACWMRQCGQLWRNCFWAGMWRLCMQGRFAARSPRCAAGRCPTDLGRCATATASGPCCLVPPYRNEWAMSAASCRSLSVARRSPGAKRGHWSCLEHPAEMCGKRPSNFASPGFAELRTQLLGRPPCLDQCRYGARSRKPTELLLPDGCRQDSLPLRCNHCSHEKRLVGLSPGGGFLVRGARTVHPCVAEWTTPRPRRRRGAARMGRRIGESAAFCLPRCVVRTRPATCRRSRSPSASCAPLDESS